MDGWGVDFSDFELKGLGFLFVCLLVSYVRGWKLRGGSKGR
jgi:hypothetical protein